MITKTIKIPKGYMFDKVEGDKIILIEEGLLNAWGGCICFLKNGEFIDVDSEIVPFEIKDENQLREEEDKNVVPVGMGNAMLALSQLLICRNAWWGRLNWEPDWEDKNQNKFCIYTRGGIIQKGVYHDKDMILAFPTMKICDHFMDSFYDLILDAKELL